MLPEKGIWIPVTVRWVSDWRWWDEVRCLFHLRWPCCIGDLFNAYTIIDHNSTSRHETLDRYSLLSHKWFSRIQVSPNRKTNGTPSTGKQHFMFLGHIDSSYGLSVATFYYGSQIPPLRSPVDSFYLSACWYWTTRATCALGFPQVQPAEKLYTFALNDLMVLNLQDWKMVLWNLDKVEFESLQLMRLQDPLWAQYALKAVE